MRSIRPLGSLVAGGAMFALSFVVLFPAQILPGVLFALGGLIVGGMLFKPRRPARALETVADGINKLEFDTVLRGAREQQRRISNEAFKITDMTMRRRIEALADVTGRIIDNVKADPADFRAARQFFDYYLDATVKIVSRYVELLPRAADAETAASLSRVEATLETMRAAYEQQLTRLLENDRMDLDTELTVLQRTIELEGLAPPPAAPKEEHHG